MGDAKPLVRPAAAVATCRNTPVLRPATPADVPFMAALHAAAWREVYAPFMPQRLMAARDEAYRTDYWHVALGEGRRGPDFCATIAEAAERQLGFSYALPGAEGVSGGEIESLFVAPGSRGLGLGRALLAAGARWLAARNLAPVVIWAFEGNPYRRFYADLGGDPRGRRDDRFPTGDEIPLIGYFWPDASALLRSVQGEGDDPAR